MSSYQTSLTNSKVSNFFSVSMSNRYFKFDVSKPELLIHLLKSSFFPILSDSQSIFPIAQTQTRGVIFHSSFFHTSHPAYQKKTVSSFCNEFSEFDHFLYHSHWSK